ncbi:hypothetical protein Lalb_Chr20g0113481 [Lupinus albus]|uniref:Uncharacterized protein n=1 Tax=Lupinus albus TaxID=3870 RepID=A0A6A4NJM8_LUPAL|nr:hypothetical protein Lalb_Chr20g0113481 [Lupinus albus]
MEGNALVLDISSDAEEEEESKSLEEKEEREGEKVIVEYDWIKHFFDVSDEEVEQGNEVVVVNEVKKKDEEEATLTSKCSSIISTKPVNDEGEEDDCVILDCDPEKNVNSVEHGLSESDELLVVGEKGQGFLIYSLFLLLLLQLLECVWILCITNYIRIHFMACKVILQ